MTTRTDKPRVDGRDPKPLRFDGTKLWLSAVTLLVLLCQAGIHVPPHVWTVLGFAPVSAATHPTPHATPSATPTPAPSVAPAELAVVPHAPVWRHYELQFLGGQTIMASKKKKPATAAHSPETPAPAAAAKPAAPSRCRIVDFYSPATGQKHPAVVLSFAPESPTGAKYPKGHHKEGEAEVRKATCDLEVLGVPFDGKRIVRNVEQGDAIGQWSWPPRA